MSNLTAAIMALVTVIVLVALVCGFFWFIHWLTTKELEKLYPTKCTACGRNVDNSSDLKKRRALEWGTWKVKWFYVCERCKDRISHVSALQKEDENEVDESDFF